MQWLHRESKAELFEKKVMKDQLGKTGRTKQGRGIDGVYTSFLIREFEY